MKKPKSRNDVPWDRRQRIPDPHVFDAALQYERARTVLSAHPPGAGVVLPLMNAAAVAIELFLKSLSAEVIHLQDVHLPEGSRVHSAPMASHHRLVDLLETIPVDVRDRLLSAFDAVLQPDWSADLHTVLGGLEGAFAASRYPFEPNADITKFRLQHLNGLSAFLADFVRSLEPMDRITPKSRVEVGTRSSCP